MFFSIEISSGGPDLGLNFLFFLSIYPVAPTCDEYLELPASKKNMIEELPGIFLHFLSRGQGTVEFGKISFKPKLGKHDAVQNNWITILNCSKPWI